MDSAEERTLEDVERILGFAKLDGTELKPTVQCLSFADELNNDGLILLELEKHMVNDLQTGDSLILKGDRKDSAVLCTKDKTYDLKEAETSNTLLLAEECLSDNKNASATEKTLIHKKVFALKHEYYELKTIKPRLKRLKHLLEENIYSGRECEEDDDHQGRKFRYDELMDLVQASDDELFTGLQKLQALVINGHWRMLDTDLISKIIESILALINEHSWSIDSIPKNRTCNLLSDLYPSNVTKHILECYGTEAKDSGNGQSVDVDDSTFSLVEDKICAFYGELILRDSKKFNLVEFEEVWQLSVPDGMKTSLQQLEGLALVDKASKPPVIKYFPVRELPEEVQERFQALFKTKDKWTLGEITPYITDLTTPKLGVGALLTKYARASNLNGVKVYGSKM